MFIHSMEMDSHWVLLIANLKEHKFEFYDQLHFSFSSNSSYNKVIHKWCTVIQNNLNSFSRPIYYPPHILQTDYELWCFYL